MFIVWDYKGVDLLTYWPRAFEYMILMLSFC
jgi:hypothetical protein